MRIIIAGERNLWVNDAIVEEAVRASGFEITEVVSGRSGTVDLTGEAWAKARGIPIQPFPADWHTFGKSAGPRRNTQMADYAEGLVLLWTGTGRGSADIKRKCQLRGLRIYERKMGGNNEVLDHGYTDGH